ncbi:MAG: PQQ-binding-like beta-propeller repeat protein [Planctomycetes bacterium]|nr:PQQ-binding-like beta-propeller repeat protein [Planctomycetota bacterium]
MSNAAQRRRNRFLFTPIFFALLGSCVWSTAQEQDLASSALKVAGVNRGIAAVIGVEESLVQNLVEGSELLVYVRDPRADAIDKLRASLEESGIGIDRVVVERGSIDELPFADNMIDIVIAPETTRESLSALSLAEVNRVLRPEGTAFLNGLEELTKNADIVNPKTMPLPQGALDGWVAFSKPPLDGADDWSHWEKSPDNNPVSSDSVIKAPYMTQFLAHPMYIGMPSITTAAGGRTFLAIGHISHHQREWDTLYKLVARNGYNGTVLWERRLPDGYLVHRSAFIATRDTFHMIDGESCLLLDAQTGEEQGRIKLPGVAGHWKWMAMKDGVLYVMTGKKERGTQIVRGDREFGGWSWADLSPGFYGDYPHGFGDTIAAYDLGEEELLWVHNEDSLIDSRSLAIRDDGVFFMCPDKHLRALQATTGEVLWTNDEEQVRSLIAEPGKGLTSTPGFKTMCLVMATPDALIIQGQTRMNVVAVSTSSGSVLWTKRKVTNNPNAIYVDGDIVLGVGKGGTHVVVDPVSGEEKADLGFRKVACTRLTACSDSFFVRGEGMLRFDRDSKKVEIDGTARPACNDGALPANGMLYIGPWQCDCNLSIIGSMARCSAGDFKFDHVATNEERLEQFVDADYEVAAFESSAADWSTFRGNVHRSSSSPIEIAGPAKPQWELTLDSAMTLTPAVASAGLVFVAGSDGKVQALEAASGSHRWEFSTLAPIKASPTVWEGRVYVGSGDGYAYCLEAATGKLLWRFRAAPVERHIMVYGNLSSTWPVNTGVTIRDGVAYFGAGIVDHDGTHVYAVDAKTGKLKWQNNSSGHLAAELRKGVAAQGNMTMLGNQLLLAGGNQVSPAPFDASTGELRAHPFQNGHPKANNGQFVGVFQDKMAIVGGRILYSAADNVATKGSFVAFSGKGAIQLNFGGVPPAWNDDTMALVNFKYGKITCVAAEDVSAQLAQGRSDKPSDRRGRGNLTDSLRDAGKVKWDTSLGDGNKFEAVSLAVCPNAILTVNKQQVRFRAQPQWYLTALEINSGKPMWQTELRGQPLPGGLLVDASGRIVVTMLGGQIQCLANGG